LSTKLEEHSADCHNMSFWEFFSNQPSTNELLNGLISDIAPIRILAQQHIQEKHFIKVASFLINRLDSDTVINNIHGYYNEIVEMMSTHPFTWAERSRERACHLLAKPSIEAESLIKLIPRGHEYTVSKLLSQMQSNNPRRKMLAAKCLSFIADKNDTRVANALIQYENDDYIHTFCSGSNNPQLIEHMCKQIERFGYQYSNVKKLVDTVQGFPLSDDLVSFFAKCMNQHEPYERLLYSLLVSQLTPIDDLDISMIDESHVHMITQLDSSLLPQLLRIIKLIDDPKYYFLIMKAIPSVNIRDNVQIRELTWKKPVDMVMLARTHKMFDESVVQYLINNIHLPEALSALPYIIDASKKVSCLFTCNGFEDIIIVTQSSIVSDKLAPLLCTCLYSPVNAQVDTVIDAIVQLMWQCTHEINEQSIYTFDEYTSTLARMNVADDDRVTQVLLKMTELVFSVYNDHYNIMFVHNLIALVTPKTESKIRYEIISYIANCKHNDRFLRVIAHLADQGDDSITQLLFDKIDENSTYHKIIMGLRSVTNSLNSVNTRKLVSINLMKMYIYQESLEFRHNSINLYRETESRMDTTAMYISMARLCDMETLIDMLAESEEAMRTLLFKVYLLKQEQPSWNLTEQQRARIAKDKANNYKFILLICDTKDTLPELEARMSP
jgi:hypothetical protein